MSDGQVSKKGDAPPPLVKTDLATEKAVTTQEPSSGRPLSPSSKSDGKDVPFVAIIKAVEDAADRTLSLHSIKLATSDALPSGTESTATVQETAKNRFAAPRE